jgi:hypothetical protein
MKRFHIRHLYTRKLLIASLSGVALSFVAGACLAPWIFAVVVWLVHQIPIWHELPGSFPNLFDFVAHPNLLLGLVWLGYYGCLYLWATWNPSPRQSMRQYEAYRRAEAERTTSPYFWMHKGLIDPEPDSPFYTHVSPPKRQEPPLSPAFAGEEKWNLVEQCYAEFRQALQRYNSPPLDLQTPPGFYYWKSKQLKWEGGYLVIPEEYLVPEKIDILKPLLAYLLARYNSDVPEPSELDDYPDYVPGRWFLALSGNFLWLPVWYKHKVETQHLYDIRLSETNQVYEADQFAVYLGQGEALEALLRQVNDELEQRQMVDQTVPTLISRIGHLEVLNRKEREAMRQLGLMVKEPPKPGKQVQSQLKRYR